MSWWSWLKSKPRLRKLRRPIERHLGVDLVQAQSVAHEIKPAERVNLQLIIDRWTAASQPAAQEFGFSSTSYYADDGVVKYLITDELIQAPMERMQFDSGPGQTLDCIVRGLCLLWRNGMPVVLGFRGSRFGNDLPVLEVIAATRSVAVNVLSALLEEAKQNNIYKGRTISVESSGAWREGILIRFHELPPIGREDMVLPSELLEVVERNVLGMLRHGEKLRAAGRSLRQGLLFHGPPGTGKTMMVRYLANACRQHTIILMTGSQQSLVREACQIARLLAPSIVVLEDVDLVAEDREHNRCPSILHELMNEMDGLDTRAEVIFLLTTNRPEFLETALSARPGRIDQAIEFPLPNEDCRRRLFQVHGRGLDLSGLDGERWVTATDGVSPAFIEELLRKATLLAVERGENSQPIRLSDADIENALRELVYFGGELTQKLLGYRSPRLGYQGGVVARKE